MAAGRCTLSLIHIYSLPQLFDAFAGVGGNRDDLRIFQKGALHLLADLITDDFQPVLIDHVLFGDDDDTLRDVQQRQDAQMLSLIHI